MIEILLHTPNGPIVEFGPHDDEESIEQAIPKKYEVAYQNSIRVATYPEHRYRAPLVLR